MLKNWLSAILVFFLLFGIIGCSRDTLVDQPQLAPKSDSILVKTQDATITQPAAGTLSLTDGRASSVSTSDQHNTSTNVTVVYNSAGGQDVEVNGVRVKAPSSSSGSGSGYSGGSGFGSSGSGSIPTFGASYNPYASGSDSGSGASFGARYPGGSVGKIGLSEFCQTSEFRAMLADDVFGGCAKPALLKPSDVKTTEAKNDSSVLEQLVLKQFALIEKLTGLVDMLAQKVAALTEK